MKKLLLFLLLLVPMAASADEIVTLNSTSICHSVFVSDNTVTTGAGKTGLAFGSMTCKFKKSDQANAAITTITLASGTVGTFTQNTWAEIADGWYQLCLPNSAYTTGRATIAWCSATGAAQMNLRIILTAQFPLVDIARWNGTALPTPHTAGYPIITVKVGTGTGEINSATGAVPVSDKTGFALSGTQTFNNTGDITGNLSGTVGSVTGAVGSVAGSVASVTGAVGSVTGNLGGNVVGSVASVTGAVGSVTGAVGSVTGAVGSVTGNLGGNVVGSVASVTGAVGSVTGAVGSVTGAVGSVTGNVGGNVTGSVGSIVTGGGGGGSTITKY